MTGVLLPQGGGTLGADEWLEVLDVDYLRSYLADGGAAVKFVVPGSSQTADHLAAQLRRRAAGAGMAIAELDAAGTRLHMVDDLFTAVSRQVDWAAVARGWLTRSYSDLGVHPAGRLGVAVVAAEEGLDPAELQRSLRRRLEQTLLADTALPRDLRTAVLRLAQTQAAFPETDPDDSATTLAWLAGEPIGAVALRRLGISGRITRSTARPLLLALGRLLTGSGAPGHRGLVLVADAERLAISRRPPLDQRDGLYYSRAAVLDAWEVLRQLIDATEQMTGMLIVVVLNPELVTDERRGLPAYTALQLRIADEVRDRRRANPFAALVRLDARLEVVR